MKPPLNFTSAESIALNEACGANCGPHALAAATGCPLMIAIDALPGFVGKGYTNPTMMAAGLNDLGTPFRLVREATQSLTWNRYPGVFEQQEPETAILRIQWEGRWLRPGVPKRAAYGYTHWIAMHWDTVAPPSVFCTAVWSPRGDEPVWIGEEHWRFWVTHICKEEGFEGWHITHRYLIDGP